MALAKSLTRKAESVRAIRRKPDAETAAKALAAAGKYVAPISATVIELQEPERGAAFVNRLRKMGMFV